ncbi:tRNA adenosine(34) deaminase TadA [Chromatium weissei]|nr:tRNA adenosine(34) deaminase TadA [Chromatium weissei]
MHDDIYWMKLALTLAQRAANHGEVPVGAVLVRDDTLIGEGQNCPIAHHDASAHAEIQALRAAGQRLGNYRLPNTRLYVTLEPCVMCAGAIIHARIDTVIFGAFDSKAGACGSVFNLLPSDSRFNHRTNCHGGILSIECAEILRQFFRARRTGFQQSSYSESIQP